MAFSNPIFGLNGTLQISQIKSPDYVPGVSGWSIKRDGSVEFNSALMRGEVVVGVDTGPQVILETLGTAAGVISLPMNVGNEVVPPRIYSTTNSLVLQGGQLGTNNNEPYISLGSSTSVNSNTISMFAGNKQMFYAEADTGSGLTSQVFNSATITPVANTPTSQVISGYGVIGLNPIGLATANTTVIGSTVQGVSVSSVSNSSITVWVYRTNATNTTVNYAIIAKGF